MTTTADEVLKMKRGRRKIRPDEYWEGYSKGYSKGLTTGKRKEKAKNKSLRELGIKINEKCECIDCPICKGSGTVWVFDDHMSANRFDDMGWVIW